MAFGPLAKPMPTEDVRIEARNWHFAPAPSGGFRVSKVGFHETEARGRCDSRNSRCRQPTGRTSASSWWRSRGRTSCWAPGRRTPPRCCATRGACQSRPRSAACRDSSSSRRT